MTDGRTSEFLSFVNVALVLMVLFFIARLFFWSYVMRFGKFINYYVEKAKIPFAFGIIAVFIIYNGFTLYSKNRNIFEQINLKQDILIPILHDPKIISIVTFIGIVLYFFRGIQPFYYGVIEFAAAIFTIGVIVYNDSQDVVAILVGLLGGLYILVRGLDNMDKGLPSAIRPAWDRMFPKVKASIPSQINTDTNTEKQDILCPLVAPQLTSAKESPREKLEIVYLSNSNNLKKGEVLVFKFRYREGDRIVESRYYATYDLLKEIPEEELYAIDGWEKVNSKRVTGGRFYLHGAR